MSQLTGRTKSFLYEKFAAALLEENEIKKAAARTSISTRTACRWLHDPQFTEFRKIYERMKGQALESAILVGLRHAEAAMKVLIDIMNSPGVPNSVSRVSAAPSSWRR